MSQDIESLIEEINFLIYRDKDYSTHNSRVNNLLETIGLELAKDILLDKHNFYSAFLDTSNHCRYGRVSYYQYDIISSVKYLLTKYTELTKSFIELNFDSNVTLSLVRSGHYADINQLNEYAINESGSLQEYAAKHCSIETLRKLKGSSNKNVRKIYYMRLGTIECLDEMLKDPDASIRGDAVRMAPFGYHGLKGMVNEIAKYPFRYLIDKLSDEDIPMILANRNIKSNKQFAKRLQERMERGLKNND